MWKPYLVAGWVSLCPVIYGGVVSGQNYPDKPVRIVTAPAGGGVDLVSRFIAQELAGPLGQPVIVDNRGSGFISGALVAKALPDGYTLIAVGNSHWLLPFLRSNVPFDPVRDFAPITLAVSSPIVLVVHPSLPVASAKELIALAKAKPGVLNYASGSTGGSNHLAAELFKAMAGVNIVGVYYKGTASALNDLIGGQVQMMFINAAAVMPHVKTARLKALAVTSLQPSALVPGLPTVASTGLPGYEASTTYGILAPAKTPPALIKRLNQEIVKILHRADIKEKFLSSGVEAVGSSPEQLLAAMKTEMATLGKVIKDAGIRED